jgi:hypothetical protein
MDFNKAYDRLEWNFIMAVLKAFGFDQNFLALIFQCKSSASFTLLPTGCQSSTFTPARGIHQRDPLSPYLFIMCSEVLARLINREVSNGHLHGVRLGPGVPGISKLFLC